ncbi:unnamed protein product [Microthlaspi erraticum]|uniref:Uncharacterized protein n=1 Tax=Microthlaspi erraticum TaxID=1685480 RepID=A0A6D2JAU1_9BRAS|nr:unnamed protein product [Microthlaspi erraticum]
MDSMSFYAIPPPVRRHQKEVNYIGGNFVCPGQNVYQGAQYQPKQQVYPNGVYQVEHPFTFPQAVAPAQQEEKLDVVFKRYMEEQRQTTQSLYEKLDRVFTDLCSKFGKTSSPIPTPSQEGEEEAEPKESQNPERFPWESKRAYKRRLVNKPLPNLEDPGKFVIPVSINGCEINDCLCDTGANEGSKRNQLLLVALFLASAGAVIDFMRNRMSLGNIQQDVFYQSINFKTAPRAIKLPPEKTSNTPQKGAMMPKDPKESEPYPKPKVAMKPSMLKHKDVFKDVNSVLLPTLDEYGANEKPYGVPNSLTKIRILVPNPKEDHTAKEKLRNTIRLFPSAFVFKGGIGDDLGVPKPPREPAEPDLGEAKGIPNLLVDLPLT